MNYLRGKSSSKSTQKPAKPRPAKGLRRARSKAPEVMQLTLQPVVVPEDLPQSSIRLIDPIENDTIYLRLNRLDTPHTSRIDSIEDEKNVSVLPELFQPHFRSFQKRVNSIRRKFEPTQNESKEAADRFERCCIDAALNQSRVQSLKRELFLYGFKTPDQ